MPSPNHAWIRELYLTALAPGYEEFVRAAMHKAAVCLGCASLWWEICVAPESPRRYAWSLSSPLAEKTLAAADAVDLPLPEPLRRVHALHWPEHGVIHRLVGVRRPDVDGIDDGLFDGVSEHLAGAEAVARHLDQRRERLLPAPRPLQPGRSGEAALTPRELDIAERVALGMTFKEIAARLQLAPSTVSTHLYNIYAKLGIRRRSDLMRWLAARRTP